MHSLCRRTSSSHLRADSPCSATLCPNLRKQSSRAAFVSGHAQQLGSAGARGGGVFHTYGRIPCGFFSDTNLSDVLLLCGAPDMVASLLRWRVEPA